MWRKKIILVLLWLSPLVAMPGYAKEVQVLASVEPLSAMLRELFAEQEHIQITTLLTAKQNPHHVSLTPKQIKRVHDADIFVWLGPQAEPQLHKIVQKYARKNMVISQLDEAMLLQEEEHDGHHHDSEIDPHLWLAPQNIELLAEELEQHRELFNLSENDWQRSLQTFKQHLAKVTEQLQDQLAPYSQTSYLSHHDAWGYFAKSFSLQRPVVVSASVEGEASSRQMVKLHQTMQQEHIHCVVAEPEARKALLKKLCKGSCQLYEIDPLGRDADSAWYSEFLLNIGDQFQQCLATGK